MRVPTGSKKLPYYSELLIHPGVSANRSGKSGRWLWLLVLHASLALLVACAGGDSDSSPPPTPTLFTLTPQNVLDETRAAMPLLDTFKFELTHTKGATLLPGNFSVREAVGFVSSPDKIQLSAETVFSGLFVKIDAVIFPDITYMTNPLTRNWNILRGDESPFAVFDPASLIADILSEVTTAAFPDEGPISDGKIVITGTLPANAMRSLVGGTDLDKVIDYRMNIDPDSFRLVAVDLGGIIRTGEEEGTQRRIELSEFNIPVEIEPPI